VYDQGHKRIGSFDAFSCASPVPLERAREAPFSPASPGKRDGDRVAERQYLRDGGRSAGSAAFMTAVIGRLDGPADDGACAFVAPP
jgi:hypothetical protein